MVASKGPRLAVPRIRVLTIVLSLLPSLAFGAEKEDFARAGPYVGVGGSYVTDTFESDLEDALDGVFPGVSVDIEESGGLNAVAGYRLLSFLAAELEYEWISEFDIALNGTKAATIEAHSLTANLKWIAPIQRVQPYFLTGLGFTHAKLEDKLGFGLSKSTTDFAGRLGVGIDVYLTSHVLLTAGANAVLTTTDFSVAGQKIDPIFYVGGQAGVQYRF